MMNKILYFREKEVLNLIAYEKTAKERAKELDNINHTEQVLSTNMKEKTKSFRALGLNVFPNPAIGGMVSVSIERINPL